MDYPPNYYNKFQEPLIESLTITINQSLSTLIFPEKLKVAKVILIFIKDDPVLIENYRPISILPPIAKKIEKLYVTNGTITSM